MWHKFEQGEVSHIKTYKFQVAQKGVFEEEQACLEATFKLRESTRHEEFWHEQLAKKEELLCQWEQFWCKQLKWKMEFQDWPTTKGLKPPPGR